MAFRHICRCMCTAAKLFHPRLWSGSSATKDVNQLNDLNFLRCDREIERSMNPLCTSHTDYRTGTKRSVTIGETESSYLLKNGWCDLRFVPQSELKRRVSQGEPRVRECTVAAVSKIEFENHFRAFEALKHIYTSHKGVCVAQNTSETNSIHLFERMKIIWGVTNSKKWKSNFDFWNVCTVDQSNYFMFLSMSTIDFVRRVANTNITNSGFQTNGTSLLRRGRYWDTNVKVSFWCCFSFFSFALSMRDYESSVFFMLMNWYLGRHHNAQSTSSSPSPNSSKNRSANTSEQRYQNTGQLNQVRWGLSRACSAFRVIHSNKNLVMLISNKDEITARE